MYKIYCCLISILFFGVCFIALDQDAEATTGSVKYISNRVKVERPEKMSKISSAPGDVTKKKDTKIAAVPKVQKKEDKKSEVKGMEQLPGPDTGSGKVVAEKSEAEIRAEISALIGRKERFYSRKGRVDPFEPFLRKPEPEVITDEKSEMKKRVPRTPLEKIDLSQLRLTAVLRTATKARALVEETSGKGYVVNEGTYIGNKGGQVSKIYKDRLMVEEKYLDVFGKISVREREMKLQQ